MKALLARDEELDGLFERIYEDNVSGKLSDDRFAKMSRRYEDEQKGAGGENQKAPLRNREAEQPGHDHGYVHLFGAKVHPRTQAHAPDA